METTQLLSVVGAYVFYSFFVMGLHLNKEGQDFVNRVRTLTDEYNKNLLERYKLRLVTDREYYTFKRNFKGELRKAKMVNMVVSPFLAVKLTLTLLFNYANGF